MSGQEFASGSALGPPLSWTERLVSLEQHVGQLAHHVDRFKTRTTETLEHTEEDKWEVFKWMDDSDAKFDDLYVQGETRHNELINKFNSLFAGTKNLIEEMRPQIARDARVQMENRLNEIQAIQEERSALHRVSDRDQVTNELTATINQNRVESEHKMKAEYEASIGEVHATLRRLLSEHEDKMTAMDVKVRRMEEELARAPHMGATSSASPHVTVPIIPPTPPAMRHVSSVKWTKGLSKLRHKEVRNFVSLFKSFQSASGMTEEELKLTLLQSLEGEALQLIASIAESSTVNEILERLLNRVRPSQSVLMKKLMETRQRMRESVYDFGARFQMISSELPTYADSRIREILIESLNETWKMTARSIVMSHSHISVEELLHKLMELEGTDAADRMEIDHVTAAKKPQFEEYREPFEVTQVVIDGRINWEEVRDPKSLTYAWKQLMRSDQAFRNYCTSWINPRPNRPNVQRNGFRPPQGNRPRPPPQNRRIFNVAERPEPECECELCEDDVFDDQEHVCAAVTEVATKGRVKVIHRSSALPRKTTNVTSSKRKPDKSYLVAATSQLKNPPLMYMRAKLDGNACDALVDTGSQVSILPHNKSKKWGIGYDSNKRPILSGFDGKESESEGIATVEVKLGGGKPFFHDFVVISSPEAKLIFGNDMMKAQECIIDPAAHQIQLKDDKVVPCHYVERPRNAPQASSSSPGWCIKSMEPIVVPPVVKDDVVLIPSGKSFALGAKSTKTMILPLTTSRTCQILDVNRLPPGITTNAEVWIRDQRLRVTVTNTTNRSVMIGSKAAIAGVVISNDMVPLLTDQAGKDRELRRV